MRVTLRPSGPLPPSVYWLRRTALALVAVGLVALVVALVATRHGRHRGAAPRTPAPLSVGTTGSSAAAPSSPAVTTSTPGAAGTAALGACAAADLTVTVSTSARAYPSGVPVTFTATAAASAPCRVARQATFVVTSGPVRVWGSGDCVDGGAVAGVTVPPTLVLLESWDRKRSAPGCATVFGTTTATAGTYHVTATVAGVTSAPVRFAIT